MGLWSKSKKSATGRVYADAAAATPLSDHSRGELMRLLDVYGNAGALHKEGAAAKNEMEAARATIAKAIDAHKDEIVFVASGTEANNLAIAGVLRPLLQKNKENNNEKPLHAITCAIEHQSILQPLHQLEREGLLVTELGVNIEGLVSPKDLRDAITPETVFVSIQLVNSEVGTIEPIKEFAKEIRKIKKERTNGVPLYLHTDAAQAPLWMHVNVERLGIDLMTLDGQKVLGPKGIGALYVRRGTGIESIIWGGVQEHGLRGGTPNTPLAGSFAVAFDDAQKNIEERVQKTSEVRDYCFDEIKKLLPDAILNGPPCAPSTKLGTSLRVANSISVSVPGLEAQMAVIALDAEGVAASTRSACTIGNEEPSHVIKALGVPKELAGTAVRLTLLPSATKADALYIAQALSKVAAKYRQK